MRLPSQHGCQPAASANSSHQNRWATADTFAKQNTFTWQILLQYTGSCIQSVHLVLDQALDIQVLPLLPLKRGSSYMYTNYKRGHVCIGCSYAVAYEAFAAFSSSCSSSAVGGPLLSDQPHTTGICNQHSTLIDQQPSLLNPNVVLINNR
jgi:hypothetical protein